jgi:hypothetical protein
MAAGFPQVVKRNSESAFQRQAVLDARSIEIHAHGGTITLRGTSNRSRSDERPSAPPGRPPGIHEVENQLVVHP